MRLGLRQVQIWHPVDAWKYIKTNFCPDSHAQHMSFFSQLIECKILQEEPIARCLFASRILLIYNHLRSIKKDFSEIYSCFQLLRYLPRELDGAVQAILHWKEENLVFKDILTELVAKESWLKLRRHDENNHEIYRTIR